MTWALIFYLSTGFATLATGGPAVIDGFKTKDACIITGERFKRDVAEVRLVRLRRGRQVMRRRKRMLLRMADNV